VEKEGDINAKIKDKLSFLYQNGKNVYFEVYLRNQNIRDYSCKERYKKVECERIHGHIKDKVKFEVRRARKVDREIVSFLNLIASQLLLLTEL
jgi:hypothetical protein